MKFILSIASVLFILSSCSTTPPPTPQNNSTVTICNQVWMTKNLDVTTYRNGDAIPQVSDGAQWGNLTTGAWCYYNNDAANGSIYGKLYNWYAVNDSRGLAPSGYHVPSDAEWTTLESCLGGSVTAGGAMKEAGLINWLSPNTGATNSSGFKCLPGGVRDSVGMFISIGKVGVFWSSTEDNSIYAFYRYLYYNVINIGRSSTNKPVGFSVRCIRD